MVTHCLQSLVASPLSGFTKGFLSVLMFLRHIPGLLGQSQPPETSGCMETVGVLEAKQNEYV